MAVCLLCSLELAGCSVSHTWLYSPDCKLQRYIVSNEPLVKQQALLQGNTWDQVALLEGHESEVKGVAWSSSGVLHLYCCTL